MGSSGFENLFKIDPQFEECKSLSPLTYYHPFQSSFDPDFGKSVSVDADKSPNSTGGFANRWTNEPVGRKLTGRSYLKSWKEEIPTRSFGTESHIQVPNTSFASFTQNMNSPQRTFSNTLSQPNRSPSDSSLFHPEFLVPDHFNLGQLNTLRIPSTDLRNISPPALDYGSSSSSNFDWKNLFEPSTQALLPAARNSSFAHQTGRKVCQDLQRTGSGNRNMICNFCKNNKEVPDIYMNHYLHDPSTKKLSCPVLRKHVCEICGETGDRAHTLQYCPVNQERGLQAKIPVLLRARTITNSTGKIRRN